MNMDVKLERSQIVGRTVIPASKSQAHRVMIASFLAGKNYDFGLQGDDVLATKACLDGLKELFDGETEVAKLDARESGSTLRFLLPIVCALDLNAEIVGEGRLPERPIGELLDVLKAHGANIFGDKLPLRVFSSCAELCLAKGGLTAGEYKMTAGVSSQYITGLLFALPLLNGDSNLTFEGELVSKGYIEMTLDVLGKFGIEIERRENGFFVRGNQKYVAKDVNIEGDWSSAAFPLALGLLTGETTVDGIYKDSKQADRVFVDIARKMGGNVLETANGFTARESELVGIDFDATDCPDIVPILAVLAGFAKGKSSIFGVDRLKAKESDRLLAVRELLGKIGVKTEYADNLLTIYGGASCVSNVEIDGFCDHRIAMSGIVAGLKLGGVTVKGVECISKSYPTFLADMKELGAKFQL